jgi:hypothetical protein
MMTVTQGQDSKGLGRWSYMRISSKKSSMIIATAYRPCIGQGPNTAWIQQWSMLREVGDKNPDPIKYFYTDLEKQITEWKQQGSEVLIMIDANEHIGEKPGGLTTLFGKMEMTDLIRHRYPKADEPNTHVRGSKRIDYIFGTNKIRDNCVTAGILPFGTGYQSDHRAIFASINIGKILSASVQAIDSITTRKLQQATPKERVVFIQETHSYLNNNNIYQRLKALQTKDKSSWEPTDKNEYEQCDKTLMEGMLLAEKRTRKLNVTSWSPIFGKAISIISFWKIALSLKTNHTYPNKKFLQWAESLDIHDTKSMDIAAIKCNFRSAQQELREVEKQAENLRENHLRSMLTASELNGDENKIQKRLQIIIRAHKQKQHFQRLKSVLKPQAATGGLSYILVPKNFKAEQYPYDASTIKEWETTHDQDEMQEFIQQRNIQHYHLKTKHGTTTTYYSHSTNTPIYGNGQGAGDSPSQWCQQSTMLFDLYSGLNDGATMTTSTGDASITKPLAAFADDTNLLGNDNTRTKTIDQRILQAQEGFTSWNELLHATAHFTELEKCACYLSIWKFQDDGYAYTVTPDDLEKQIEVNDLNGNKLTIRQLSATDSQKLLGVMKNPIGNQQDEIHRLKEKSNKLALQINSHALSRFEAKMAYDSFYIPAMRYSLSTTSINQMDFETIQKNATNSLMSALGYNRHMQREVVFCTQKYQGLGFKHMYDIQGTDSVRLLLQELNFNEGTTTTMIRILLEVIQQEAGIQAPILEDNRPLQYIEWGWIPSIRDFLHHIDAKITNATTGLTIY